MATTSSFSPSSSRMGVKTSSNGLESVQLSSGPPRLSPKGGLSTASGLRMSDTTEFWEGDWVCADCGYIYDADIDDPKGEGRPFELMVRGFICPQCSAPRKRYAKAVNGQWGVTNDGGDLPIYFGTFLGLAITTWFALVYVPTL
jgi:rubredoxin